MLKHLQISPLVLLALALLASSGRAQTCSCAGAPLISTQSAGASEAGSWILGLTHEYHAISSIYNGTDLLKGDETRRTTNSTLFEVSYGITDRLNASGTFTFVRKDRSTGIQVPGTGNTVVTYGIGDGLTTLDYSIIQQSLWNRFGWNITGGVKIPFGSTTRTSNGFQLNADMQPGTGAWDGVIGTRFSVSLLPHATINLFTNAMYRHTGANDRFNEDDIYEFGNELVANLGAAGELNDRLSYVIQMRYRSTSSDQRNSQSMPNTGGYWFTL